MRVSQVGLGAAGLAIAAVALIALPDRPPPARARPLRETPSGIPAAPPRLAAPPALDGDGLALELAGGATRMIDSAALADRPATLQATDRRAWRLAELLDSSYLDSSAVIHARTNDGGDYILNGDGRSAADIIVVRRVSGELYVGWLTGAAGRPLADAERPAERIEHVARITITAAPAAPAAPITPITPIGPRLTVRIDGQARQIVTVQSFAAAATLRITGPREGDARAIDVAHAFGQPARLVGLTAAGVRVAVAPPTREARAVVYLSRRGRFKLAWIDADGTPIAGSKQREITELELRSGARLASRP